MPQKKNQWLNCRRCSMAGTPLYHYIMSNGIADNNRPIAEIRVMPAINMAESYGGLFAINTGNQAVNVHLKIFV